MSRVERGTDKPSCIFLKGALGSVDDNQTRKEEAVADNNKVQVSTKLSLTVGQCPWCLDKTVKSLVTKATHFD